MTGLETARRKRGRGKLIEHERRTGQACCHIVKFLRTGVHDVDADTDSLTPFEHQIAVVVQYRGFERKGRASRSGRTTRAWKGNHGRCHCCRCRRRCRARRRRRCRSRGRELAPGRFDDFVRKFTRRTLNEVVQDIVAILLQRLNTDPSLLEHLHLLLCQRGSGLIDDGHEAAESQIGFRSIVDAVHAEVEIRLDEIDAQDDVRFDVGPGPDDGGKRPVRFLVEHVLQGRAQVDDLHVAAVIGVFGFGFEQGRR